ncbi:MAG: M48 family metalloprotease [Candidatus Thorarchaeota archaeon]
MVLFFSNNILEIILDWTFLITCLLYIFSIEEFYRWAKNGKRSELSDFVAIFFFFFLILFFSKDLLTSIMGAFSIYMWFAIIELKEYEVINKLLIISLITYNVIFISGIISNYLGNPLVLNTSFAFSFWIILGLGFILFGRKYIIVWRFLSPEYLTLFLYIIAWIAVVFLNQYTPINFYNFNQTDILSLNLLELLLNIYIILIFTNWVIYFISGPILDKLLGIKRVKDKKLLKLVSEIKELIGIRGKVKVGYGKYPILNAMAYGSFFDKRIAIIAENISEIPQDELKGIIAHELSHTKGKHTLILTFITSLDLLIRMFLGIPATYYDYTFGNPKIPLVYFIFLNIGIYVLIFIFVRILEGKADLRAKNAGLGNELVKALYNLESFYASGREIGLNTMLLCNEKINKDNQLLNYKDTAEYIYLSMIKPSRTSLIGNIINSHPPSYYRVAAILDDKLKPTKEALLPFFCLRRSVQKKYAKKFENARNLFKQIANTKFKEYFNINNISTLMKTLRRDELFQFDLNKDYLFRNKITDELIIGKFEEVQYSDDICDIDQFLIFDAKNKNEKVLNSSLFNRYPISLNKKYFFKKDNPLILKDIELFNNNTEGKLIFLDNKKNLIFKRIRKTKLSDSIDTVKEYVNNEIFLKVKGRLQIYVCINVKISDNLNESVIELLNPKENSNYILKFKDIIIRPKNIYFSITKNKIFRESELNIIHWLKKKKLRTFLFLKKAVNNLEIGYIQDIRSKNMNANKSEFVQNNNEIVISIENIFGKKLEISYKSLELVSFDFNTAIIQRKSETSLISKLGYRILRKIKPEKIFYLNKV